MINLSSYANDFLNVFSTLSPNIRKIFQLLHGMARKFRSVFPSILKIAFECCCSFSTVKRATALFVEMGWIVKIKRGYQSNVYLINDEILKLNLNDPSLMSRPCAVNEPVLENKKEERVICTEDVPINKIIIPSCIEKSDLPQKDKIFLTRKFSEYTLENAMSDARWYLKQGNKVLNPIGLIISLCKKYK